MPSKHIAIVGAGIGGLSAAWGLLQAGHTVTVYEKDRIGAGASGLALGALAAFGPHVRGNLARVARESVTVRWPRFAQHLSNATNTRIAAFYRQATPELAQINVPTLLYTLSQALRNAGAKIREGAAIADPATLLKTYDLIILAAGWGNAALANQSLRIDAGQAICVSVPPDLYPHIPLTYDPTEKLYLVPGWSATDGIMIGSASYPLNTPGDFTPDPSISTALLAQAISLQPALAAAVITRAWVGYRPAMRGGLLPLLRPTDHPHIYAVTGLGKLGYCLAPALAETIASFF